MRTPDSDLSQPTLNLSLVTFISLVGETSHGIRGSVLITEKDKNIKLLERLRHANVTLVQVTATRGAAQTIPRLYDATETTEGESDTRRILLIAQNSYGLPLRQSRCSTSRHR